MAKSCYMTLLLLGIGTITSSTVQSLQREQGFMPAEDETVRNLTMAFSLATSLLLSVVGAVLRVFKRVNTSLNRLDVGAFFTIMSMCLSVKCEYGVHAVLNYFPSAVCRILESSRSLEAITVVILPA